MERRDWLVEEIKKTGLTQKDFAVSVEIKPSVLESYIAGYRDPRVPAAKRIAKGLGIDWGLFYPDGDGENRPVTCLEEGRHI